MGEQIFKKVTRLMGNRFELSAVDQDPDRAHEIIELGIAEIQRIEKLLTTFSDDSQTQQINRYAGISAVRVDPEVFGLIARANQISELTRFNRQVVMEFRPEYEVLTRTGDSEENGKID
jgi:FAD:protein FMN transferase